MNNCSYCKVSFMQLLTENSELCVISVLFVNCYFLFKGSMVPLLGTRLQYRQRGMCRALMNVLEKVLY